MRDLLPNGLLGLAITGLLAAFMAGMAANISAFNTVFSYDLWDDYVVKDREDDYYLRIGRIATVAATAIAILTAPSPPTSPTSWTTCRRCSASSTRRCSRPSSSACSGSG